MIKPIGLMGLCMLLCAMPLWAGDELLDLMSDEMDREMARLKQEDVPPYYMSYAVTDVRSNQASASFGALTGRNDSNQRMLSVVVRVGDHDLDNTRQVRGDFFSQMLSRFSGYAYLPLDGKPEAVRTALWRETGKSYRKAIEQYAKVKANVAVKVEAEDTSPDFSREDKPAVHSAEPIDFDAKLGDPKLWEERLKQYTAMFLESEEIYGGQATFIYKVERKRLVTTEGTRLIHNLSYTHLFISAFTKADDGMELPLYLNYFAFEPADLPDDVTVLEECREMMEKLEKMRVSPLVDPYTGPAILSGKAAGVFFHEVLGHRIEGTRQKSEFDGQTFKKKVGETILPEALQIYSDPTTANYKGADLVGRYTYDDEGISARRVNVVKDGVLENFLMARTPIEGFHKSNGHGRAAAGRNAVARQSNLIVETHKPMTDQELRRKLIESCKEQDRPYGLYFKEIRGGFTRVGRSDPNTFNVMPIEVYRIFTDGRPDELVRGVDLIGTPLLIFSRVVAGGNDFEVFNGVCGAESGGVPVSAVSPSLFLDQVEVQKKLKSQELPPILPRPDTEKKKKKTPKESGF